MKIGDGGSPIPQPPPAAPILPAVPPAPPTQPPAPLVQLAAPPVQPGLIPRLNCSHFKLEFAGKPDEDAEVYLLMTNNWMDTHVFPEGIKVQRFYATLVGEARLWYESLRPITLDWNGLRRQFRQQYLN